MTRFPHFMRANAKVEQPRHLIIVDTETDTEQAGKDAIRHKLRFGWACYQRRRDAQRWCEPEWFRFERTHDFWVWVNSHAKPKTNLSIWCHNTNFDLPVLDTFRDPHKMGWRLNQAIIDAPPTILVFRKADKKLTILDTLNLWRMPLASIGKMIGSPKLDMPTQDAPLDAWNRYARQDVEILRAALIDWLEFLRREDMGNFRPTLASQSMGTYKHKYMTQKILIHTNGDALKLERESYHGGRVECFRIGKIEEPTHLLDVNSMFPAVMQTEMFPASFVFFTDSDCTRAYERFERDHQMIADCLIESREPVYAKHVGGRLCFPVGRFWTALTSPEIKYAIKHGHLIGMKRISVYRPAKLFAEFVRDLWARRAKAKEGGNEPLAWNYKILMNSLYGKFGQTGRIWEPRRQIDDLSSGYDVVYDAPTGKIIHTRRLGGLEMCWQDAPESAESCPAIAAFVTAYARMMLWRLIQTAETCNVYYCDTDSVLVNDAGLRNLRNEIDPTRIGKLKLEAHYTEAQIWGPKDYRFGALEKHKGIRKNAKWLDESSATQQQWQGLRGWVRKGATSGPLTTTVTKHLARNYTKGLVREGGLVSPLEIMEDA